MILQFKTEVSDGRVYLKTTRLEYKTVPSRVVSYTNSESTIINVLTSIDHNNEETVIEWKQDESSEVSFDLKGDGIYKVYKIIIPNETWDATTSISKNNYIFKDGAFYHNNEKSDIKEILLVNNTNLYKKDYQFFSMCNLQKCYLRHCEAIFRDMFNFECEKRKKVDTFNRDLLQMCIHMMCLYVKRGQFVKALLVLHRIYKCNGICQEESSLCCGRSKPKCGCSGR